MSSITFPETEPRWVIDRDCVAFPALVDGKPVECLVTAELLMQRFGAREWSEQEFKRAYLEHREEIQALARSHIEMGWIGPDNRVLLTTLVTSLNVTYHPGIRQWGEGFALVQNAFRILAGVIGPNAGAVNVEWDSGKDARGRAVVILRLSDATGSVTGAFDPKELESPSRLRIRLFHLWGDLLQIRSHQLLLKSG